MKKKIVYISGADVFDVNDVRAAFDEVRNALNLDSDTILFGVPVDEAESVQSADASAAAAQVDAVVPPVVDTESENPGPDKEETVIDEPVSPVKDSETETGTPVVPILSILASNEDDEIESEPETATVEPEPVVEIEESVQVELNESDDSEPDESEPDIADMINDDLPSEPGEKTLEELLETMTPLREDAAAPVKKKATKKSEPEPVAEQIDEIDATLENLASEFAESQDKVADSKKSSERGKIGKLKNILPFKKVKRDDSGLMGDLFGWAGIAANDDDFTIPGFFKQKM